MGYPASTCEKYFINSLSEVKTFLFEEHGTNVKIYNLCMELDRIYHKKQFNGAQVALFPFEDHQSCPIKLMLEFCIDLCLFFLSNPDHVSAIHSMNGKGRTGIMVCSYLLFSGIAKNSSIAFKEYGLRRSINNKGLTVASQKRYVHHFETYLNCNFQTPYFKLIPKIRQDYLTPPNGNLLTNVFGNKDYYNHTNSFKITKIKLGPFNKKLHFNCQILNFKSQAVFNTESKMKKINYKFICKEEHEQESQQNLYYFIIELVDELIVDSDINIKIYGKLNFNAWVNFFYITLENFIYLVNTEFKDMVAVDNSNLSPHMQISTGSSLLSSSIRKLGMTKNKNSSTYSLYKRDISNHDINVIEMSEIGSSTSAQKSPEAQKQKREQLKKESEEKAKGHFVRSYDANYFWENNITLDGARIKNFLQLHTNYAGNNIHSYDLHNIYEFLNREKSNLFNGTKKKFKTKLSTFGLDNFKMKKEMMTSFCIDITYCLI